ncbi:MAG: GNAT family N-acetyltransferase [Aquincola sp.]|nr:GNAT family N-acetyltransferase [Aquincola sp.]MDH5328462.1 GNAT family N-acetyltransferase [Aquincola sp.]
MIADISIELARRADAAAIAALSRDAIEHGLPWRWTPTRVRRAIEHPETNVAVVRELGAVVAFGIMIYAGETAHLQLLAVRPSRRRCGVGSALLIWLEGVARAAGIARIGLEARVDNAAGRCFYSEHGYHERHIVAAMYGGRFDGVRMEKWLRPAAQ